MLSSALPLHGRQSRGQLFSKQRASAPCQDTNWHMWHQLNQGIRDTNWCLLCEPVRRGMCCIHPVPNGLGWSIGSRVLGSEALENGLEANSMEVSQPPSTRMRAAEAGIATSPLCFRIGHSSNCPDLAAPTKTAEDRGQGGIRKPAEHPHLSPFLQPPSPTHLPLLTSLRGGGVLFVPWPLVETSFTSDIPSIDTALPHAWPSP